MRLNMDGTTREGALRHAKIIAAYWQKRGFDVVTEVIDTGAKAEHGLSGTAVYGVRSNLVNGMPQRAKRYV